MIDKNNLPFGRHKWRLENNICNEGKTNLETLQLSSCPEGGFTCDDGKCLDISQRCNNIEVRNDQTIGSILQFVILKDFKKDK